MRTLLAVAAAGLALTAAPATADAPDVVVLHCEFYDARCSAAGTVDGGITLTGAHVHADGGATCLATDTLVGTMSGAIDGTFTATRVGAVVTWNVSGSFSGSGVGLVDAAPSCPPRWSTGVVTLVGS